MTARDGFVIVRKFFSEAELAPLLDAYRSDPTVNGALYGMIDDEGEPHPICICVRRRAVIVDCSKTA